MKPLNRSVWMGATVLAAVLGLTAVAYAADEVNTDKTGLAIGGYDPVSYFSDTKPAKGDFQITAEHEGAVYRFVNKENRDKFLKEPAKYTPHYGGYCAYGIAKGKKFAADPTVWQIVDGRLMLNLDEKIAKTFNTDLQENVVKADKNWKKLKEEPAR